MTDEPWLEIGGLFVVCGLEGRAGRLEGGGGGGARLVASLGPPTLFSTPC